MRYLLSRYGGNTLVIGKGKASAANLPEDQSIELMIDHYAKEIIPNLFYISSYDALPNWMGGMDKLYFPNTVKLGTLTHRFNELFLQYDVTVTTDIYIASHHWSNVYAVFIKTHKGDLSCFIDGFKEQYDYVLNVFIRNHEEDYDGSLYKNPENIEKILLLLCYKMGLTYENDIYEFVPSRTYLGKRISQDFIATLPNRIVNMDSDAAMGEVLKTILTKKTK